MMQRSGGSGGSTEPEVKPGRFNVAEVPEADVHTDLLQICLVSHADMASATRPRRR